MILLEDINPLNLLDIKNNDFLCFKNFSSGKTKS